MIDIAPDLIDRVNDLFHELIRNDKQMNNLIREINSGNGTYETGNKLAIRFGNDLSKAYKLRVSMSDLPEETMFYNIARRLLDGTLIPSENMLYGYLEKIQETLNEEYGLGIKAVRPDLNQDRVDGLVERLTKAENDKDLSSALGEPITNIHQSVVDDFVRENAKAHSDAGLKPKIVRKLGGRACEWCRKLAGTYDYSEVSDTGNDVFRRHENCRCTVDYVDGKTRKNVWTKIENKRKIVHGGVGAKKHGFPSVVNPITGKLFDYVDGKPIIPEDYILAGYKNPRGEKINDIKHLLDDYPETSERLWQKIKRQFEVYDEYGEIRRIEIHSYKHPDVGIIEDKVKVKRGRVYVDEWE